MQVSRSHSYGAVMKGVNLPAPCLRPYARTCALLEGLHVEADGVEWGVRPGGTADDIRSVGSAGILWWTGEGFRWRVGQNTTWQLA